MEKTENIKELYSRIFGSKVKSIDFENYVSSTPTNSEAHDKCKSCGNRCSSFSMIQDLPYYKDIESVDTIVIAEAPGNAIEKGSLGYVFGWNEWKHTKSRKLLSYRNFFFALLDLDPEKTYITDGVKCYASKADFTKVFKNCNIYLEQEISILRPKKVLMISKQTALKQFLETNKSKYSYELLQIPHPSNQNLSKIPTVGEIFREVGQSTNNQNWITLGKEIEAQYNDLRNKLNEI